MEQFMNGILDSQKFESLHFDEVYTSFNVAKEHYKSIVERFNNLSISDFQRINNEVKTAFLIWPLKLPISHSMLHTKMQATLIFLLILRFTETVRLI